MAWKRTKNRFTEAQKLRMVELWRNDTSYSAIAKQAGCSAQTVSNIVDKYGEEAEVEEEVEEEETTNGNRSKEYMAWVIKGLRSKGSIGSNWLDQLNADIAEGRL